MSYIVLQRLRGEQNTRSSWLQDVGFDALWRLTTETHEQWIHGSDYLAAILEVPGLRKERCVPDWMHQGHLGVLPLFEGGVILDLVEEQVWPGSSLKEKLHAAWVALKSWCSKYHISCSMDEFTPDRLNHNFFYQMGMSQNKSV